MPKKRKLNSKNPKYNKDNKETKKETKRVLISEDPNKKTDVKFKCYGIWKI